MSVYLHKCNISTLIFCVISWAREAELAKVVCEIWRLTKNSLLLSDAEQPRARVKELDEITEDRYGELLSIEDNTNPKFRWTPKKRRFCYYMGRLGSVREATTRAGYTNPEYGNILMMEPAVRLQVQHEVRAVLRAESENEETVIARWARWAQVDIGHYFKNDWDLVDIDQLTEGQRKCIKKVKITQNQFGRNVDLELHDAHKANNDLAVMMGILGKAEEGKLPPEEQAKTIQQMLKEMREVDGLQEPPLESGTKRTDSTTH